MNRQSLIIPRKKGQHCDKVQSVPAIHIIKHFLHQACSHLQSWAREGCLLHVIVATLGEKNGRENASFPSTHTCMGGMDDLFHSPLMLSHWGITRSTFRKILCKNLTHQPYLESSSALSFPNPVGHRNTKILV